MKSLDIFLSGLLMVCALALVNAQHRARMQFVELESLKKEAKDLEVEWSRLQIEQSSLADPKHVEAVATGRLGLALPAIDKIWLLGTDE